MSSSGQVTPRARIAGWRVCTNVPSEPPGEGRHPGAVMPGRSDIEGVGGPAPPALPFNRGLQQQSYVQHDEDYSRDNTRPMVEPRQFVAVTFSTIGLLDA